MPGNETPFLPTCSNGIGALFLRVSNGLKRFIPEVHRGYYGIRDISALNGLLERMAPIESSLRLAMHINYAKSLAAHFPENRGTALEIGHGKTASPRSL